MSGSWGSIVGGFSCFGETLFPFSWWFAFYTLLRVMPIVPSGSRAWHGTSNAVLYLVSKGFVYTSLAVSTNIIYGSLAALPIFFSGFLSSGSSFVCRDCRFCPAQSRHLTPSSGAKDQPDG